MRHVEVSKDLRFLPLGFRCTYVGPLDFGPQLDIVPYRAGDDGGRRQRENRDCHGPGWIAARPLPHAFESSGATRENRPMSKETVAVVR